jgi:hypothetical protein
MVPTTVATAPSGEAGLTPRLEERAANMDRRRGVPPPAFP